MSKSVEMKKSVNCVLCNAFSLQMLGQISDLTNLTIEPIQAHQIPETCMSAIGHADTAAVLTTTLGFPVPMNRANVTLDESTILYVAQLVGGRLPEGSTTLPEGFSFRYFKVYLGNIYSYSPDGYTETVIFDPERKAKRRDVRWVKETDTWVTRWVDDPDYK